ncbi:hypothetical protein H7H53_11450 [Mycobacterium lacus]|nr:hypothetical protein [Mycobacterium lacus]
MVGRVMLAGYCRTPMLSMTSVCRHLAPMHPVPADHCRRPTVPMTSARRHLAPMHPVPVDHYRMLTLLVENPLAANASRLR